MAAESVPSWTPWVSALALIVGVLGLSWQIWSYLLSGARVKVRLSAGLLPLNGAGLLRGVGKGWPKNGPSTKEKDLLQHQPAIHLAVVEVVNIGRMPVFLSDVELDFGVTSFRRPWVRTRRSTNPLPVLDGKAASKLDRHQPTRLDAGARHTVIMFFGDLALDSRRRSVRATAQPVGRRRRKSPWHQRWRSGADVPQCPWIEADPVEQQLLETIFPLAILGNVHNLNATYQDLLRICGVGHREIHNALVAALYGGLKIGRKDRDQVLQTAEMVHGLAPAIESLCMARALPETADSA